MPKTKPVYGIIGNPLKHSLSPVMHNTAFKELGLDAVYKLFPIEENELADFFKNLRDPSSPIFGLNVTVPYKEKIISFMDNISPFSLKAHAVNTIVINKQRKLMGYNTDGPGFLAHLAELQFDAKGKNIAILGAGGSTRGILTSLCLISERPKSIKIYNRTTERALELTRDLMSRINLEIVEVVLDAEDLDLRSADLLVNTTSVGMKDSDPLLIDENSLHEDLFVYDIIYNPAKTLLLKTAEEKGAKVSNGLGMLFYQGVLSFQHWAGGQLDTKVKQKMRDSLEKALQ